MKLTIQNYFTLDNKYISNSKLNDWLKCKNYFYRKHVLGSIKSLVTAPLILGRAVDTWLTDGEEIFKRNYVCVSRRNLKNPPKGLVELNMSQFDQTIEICQAVEATSAYKELKDHKSQTILSYDLEIGLFKGICGIPDWFKIEDNGTAVITDLKTTQDIDDKKYFYHCLRFGYFRQQAMYQVILKNLYPKIKTFISRHLVVEKEENISTVKTFILNQERIENEKENLFDVLDAIKVEKKFLKADAKWESAIELGALTD